jgi:hypothetical protein
VLAARSCCCETNRRTSFPYLNRTLQVHSTTQGAVPTFCPDFPALSFRHHDHLS